MFFPVTAYIVKEEPHSWKAPSSWTKPKGFPPLFIPYKYKITIESLTKVYPLKIQVTPGSSCVVFGLGGIGSAIVMACKASGACRIIGVDINEEKFPRARALGVTDCLNPNKLKKPVQEVVKEMTGVGVDFAFEAIGLIETMVCVLGTMGA